MVPMWRASHWNQGELIVPAKAASALSMTSATVVLTEPYRILRTHSFQIVLVACASLVTLVGFSGCRRAIPASIRIADVTRSNTFLLTTSSRSVISGITLNLNGKVDGVVSVWIGHSQMSN